MAGRVNTKFVIGLLVVVTVLAVGVAAWWYFGVRRDPGRYIAQANTILAQADQYRDEAMQLVDQSNQARAQAQQADGDRARELLDKARDLEAQARALMDKAEFDEAAGLYRRAYSFEKDTAKRVALLNKLADLYGKMPAEDTEEALELVRGVEQCYAKIIDLDPGNVPAAEKLLEHSYGRARLFPQYIQFWNQLYTQAGDLLKFAPDSIAAHRHRGIAQVIRIERLNLGEADRTQAREDLTRALAADPDDGQAAYHLSLLDMLDAREARRLNQAQQAQALEAQAMKRIGDFVAEHPDDIDARLGQFRLNVQQAATGGEAGWQDQALAKLDALADRLLEADHPLVAREVAQLLINFDRRIVTLDDGTKVRSGLHRAERLLTSVIERHPADITTMTTLGIVLKQQGRLDDAVTVLNQAKRDRAVPVTVEALRAADYRVLAMRELGDIHLSRYEQLSRTGDEAGAQAARDKAQEQITTVEALRGERNAMVLMLQGKLALIDGDARKAQKLLSDANVQFEGQQAETLMLLAQAHRQTGNAGAAASALERLLRTGQGGRMPAAYLQLAQLELNNANPDKAMSLVDRLLAAVPGNPQAIVLKSAILLRQAGDDEQTQAGAIQQARQLLQPLVDQGDREAVRQMASLHSRTGDQQAAADLLAAFYEDHPDDTAVLQQLIQLDRALGQTDRAIARVQAAIEREPDNKFYPLMLAALQGEDVQALTEQLADVVSDESDPVQRQLALWRLYSQTGKRDLAEQALDKAKQLGPEHEQVLTIGLEQALAEDDLETADRIVERVSKMNDGQGIDYAHGAFWLARVQMARQQYKQAVATLERGVEQMSTDSNAWLLLGNARMMIGDMNNAERALQRALELRPQNVSAWRQLHRVHDLRDQHEQALEDLRRALRYSGGRDSQLYLTYIDYMGRHGDRDQAIQARWRIADRVPDNHANRRSLAELYLMSDQPDQARQILDELLAEAPDDRANIAAMAVYLASQGQFEQGKQLLLDRVHELQDAGEVASADWRVVARYLRRGNQADSALSAYRKAIEQEDPDTMPVTREMADWLFGRDRYAQAAQEYERLLSATAEDPTQRLVVWRRYVETLVNNDQIDQAQTQLDQLLEKHPADAQSLMIKGLIAERRLAEQDLGDERRQQLREVAETAYDQAVLYAPATPMPYIQRARFRFDRESENIQLLVRDDLTKAIELDSNNIAGRELLVRWYLNRGEMDQAIAEQQRLVTARPNYARGRAQLAEMYIDRGDWVKLDPLLAESQRLMPNTPAWHQYRARMYQAQNRPADAEAELARAYELDASPGRMIEYVGVLLRRGKHDQARALLNDRPEELTRVPVMAAMRGRALAGLNRTDEATNAFTQALQLAGDNTAQIGVVVAQIQAALNAEDQLALLRPLAQQDRTGALWIAVGQLMLTQGRTEQALDELKGLDQTAELSGRAEVDWHRLLARCYYDLKQYPQSRRHYERVLEAAPNDLVALNNLAFLLADNLDQSREALKLAERALALAGNNAPQKANVLDTLGWVQHCAGDTRTAIDTLQRSVRLRPMIANRLHLAKVLLAGNRPASARQALSAARQMAEEQQNADALEEIDSLVQQLASADADAER